MFHLNHIEIIECARTEGFSAGQSYVKANGKPKAYAEAKRLGDECPNPDAKSFGYIDGFMNGVLSSPCVNDREFSVDGRGYFNFKPMPER